MTDPALYRRHRFPSEVISHCVRLYFRFSISYRDVEEMMAVRGLTLTYETMGVGGCHGFCLFPWWRQLALIFFVLTLLPEPQISAARATNCPSSK